MRYDFGTCRFRSLCSMIPGFVGLFCWACDVLLQCLGPSFLDCGSHGKARHRAQVIFLPQCEEFLFFSSGPVWGYGRVHHGLRHVLLCGVTCMIHVVDILN